MATDDNVLRAPRRGPVLAIVVTLIIGGSIVALLLYRAVLIPEPDCVIVVRANAEWLGVELRVEGGSLPEPRTTQVQALGRYTVPFFLPPGQYTLHVTSQGVEVWTQQFELSPGEREEIDLARTGASTQPTSQPVSQPAATLPDERAR
jgi:hypothetical protein